MGEVYLANDTKLDRKVALKILPPDVSDKTGDRVRRFIQEAKSASALNHPNILTVYEIGRAADTTYIATEFVDGLTLRQHLHHLDGRFISAEVELDQFLVTAFTNGKIGHDTHDDVAIA